MVTESLDTKITATDAGASRVLNDVTKTHQENADKIVKSNRKISDASKEAAKETEDFVSALTLGVGVALSAVAAYGAAAVALFKLASSSADMGDEIFIASRKLGVSTEFLSEWNFVATQTGATTEDVTKGLATLSKNVVTNSAEFRKWGVELEKNDGTLKSSEELFEDTIKLLSEMDAGVQRTAAAQDLMGRSGKNLLQVVDQSADGIEDLKQKARDLGIVMDEESAAAANEFNNQLGALTDTFDDVLFEAGSIFIPGLTEVFKLMQNVVSSGGKAFRDFRVTGQDSFNNILKAAGNLAVGMVDVGINIEKVFDVLEVSLKDMKRLAVDLVTAIPGVQSIATTFLGLFLAAKKTSEQIKTAADVLGVDLPKGSEASGSALVVLKGQIEDFIKGLDDLDKATAKTREDPATGFGFDFKETEKDTDLFSKIMNKARDREKQHRNKYQ